LIAVLTLRRDNRCNDAILAGVLNLALPEYSKQRAELKRLTEFVGAITLFRNANEPPRGISDGVARSRIDRRLLGLPWLASRSLRHR
jgi:hypothetical protein